jgi:tetratricopeptide (TPR) repeat protein
MNRTRVEMPPPALELRWGSKWIPGAVVILLLVLISYIPAMRGGYIWDDETYVLMNPALKSLRGLQVLWSTPRSTPQYYPLVFTTFWIEYHLWGLEPLGYHIVNVLLHAANALLLWGILKRLSVSGAWLAAAIFALHPVHVESVAWITERKNVLSGFFYFLAMWSYIRFADLNRPDEPPRKNWAAYILSLLFFLMALFSKTVTCSLPAAICLILWWKRARVRGRELLPLVPMFAFGLIMASATAWLEKHHVSGGDLKLGLTPLDRIVLCGQAAWFYLGKLFWPHPLSFMYEKWAVDYRLVAQWMYAGAAAICLIMLWLMRRRIGKGPLVAALFFGGTLLPALGFVDVYPMRYSWVADHFQYLASIGPIVLVSAVLFRLATGSSARPPAWTPIPALALCLLLGWLTWVQGRIYKDIEVLWRDTIAKSPNAWIAYNNLGSLLNIKRGPEAAAPFVEKAMKLNPQNPEAYLNLAMIRLDQGRGNEALPLLDEAHRLYGGDTPHVRYHRARVFLGLQRYDEALREISATIAEMPGYAPAYFVQGRILMRAGRAREANESFKHTLFIDPDFVEAICFLADACASQKQIEQAITLYEEAIRRAPEYFQAYFNYANLLISIGRASDALKPALQAATIQPENPDAQVLVGAICQGVGQPTEAVAHFGEAVRLSPTHVEARFNYANTLKSLGRNQEAIEQYKEVLKQNPNDSETKAILDQMLRSPTTQSESRG